MELDLFWQPNRTRQYGMHKMLHMVRKLRENIRKKIKQLIRIK